MSATAGSVEVDPSPEGGYPGVGRCMCFFWFALAHDVLGVVVIMTGVFGGLFIHDLFIYVGAIIIFLSLIWWVMWYTLNIDVSPKELEDDVGKAKPKERVLSRLVRDASERLSTIRASFRRSGRRSRSNPGPEVMLSSLSSPPGGPVSAV